MNLEMKLKMNIKMKVRSLLFSTLCVVAMSAALTACSNDEEDSFNDEGSVVELPHKRAFILNEGKYKANNSGIAFYAPDGDAKESKNNFIADLYKVQNQKSLGDSGFDMIAYDDHIYVVVYGSKLLLKLNEAGVEQKQLTFGEADGQPRCLEAKDGKIYVSLYSGKVARIDASTLAIEAYVSVNANPEQMVIEDDKLYVANSGWGSGNTVSVIDLATFNKLEDIPLVVNPNYLLEANGEIYAISYGAWNDPVTSYSFQRIKADGTLEIIPAKASVFAEHNDIIYLIDSKTDWKNHTAINTLCTYNAKTHELNTTSFLKEMPEALKNSIIYGISINEKDGDIYLLTSNYASGSPINGDVYRFSANGTFVETFDCGGINPKKIVFID